MEENEDIDRQEYGDIIYDYKDYDYHEMNSTTDQIGSKFSLETIDMLSFAWSSVTTGIFIWLSFWSLRDILQRNKIEFLRKISVLLVIIMVLDLIEYFVFLDFYFFQNLPFSQGLAFTMEYFRYVQKTLIFGLGINELIKLHAASSTNRVISRLTARSATWSIFIGNGFLLPILILGFKLMSGNHHNTILTTIEFIVLPLVVNSVLFVMIYSKAKKNCFHFNLEEIAQSKMVATLILIILVETLEYLILEEAIVFLSNSFHNFQPWKIYRVLRDGTKDFNKIFFPLSYILIYHFESKTADRWLKKFNNPSITRMQPTERFNSAAFNTEMNSLIFHDDLNQFDL